jgi:hypothetical protein
VLTVDKEVALGVGVCSLYVGLGFGVSVLGGRGFVGAGVRLGSIVLV